MIYIHKGAIADGRKFVSISQANLKIIVLDKYEVSIAFDDSCGSMINLSRVDARVFELETDNDITNDIFNEPDVHILEFKDIATLIEMVEIYHSEKE